MKCQASLGQLLGSAMFGIFLQQPHSTAKPLKFACRRSLITFSRLFLIEQHLVGPNRVRQVMIKTHYSRVQQDQRTLANALNLYQGDHSAYPTREEGLQKLIGAYVPQLPIDPFSNERRETYASRTYLSPVSGQPFFVLISQGPDGDFDFDSPEGDDVATGSDAASHLSSFSPFVLAQPLFAAELTAHTYDPTNGIGSGGDIIEYR